MSENAPIDSVNDVPRMVYALAETIEDVIRDMRRKIYAEIVAQTVVGMNQEYFAAWCNVLATLLEDDQHRILVATLQQTHRRR